MFKVNDYNIQKCYVKIWINDCKKSQRTRVTVSSEKNRNVDKGYDGFIEYVRI